MLARRIDRLTINEWPCASPSALVMGIEGKHREKVREVHMKPDEVWTKANYHQSTS